MGKNSSIEWTHHTFNPWWGCTKISDACKYCYAETWSKRIGKELWGDSTERRFFGEDHWTDPFLWDKEASKHGIRSRVFCASMADVFEDRDELYPWRDRLWGIIEKTHCLNWLLLSKRPENISKMIPWKSSLPTNVWLGATIENQYAAKKRIPELIKHKASVRFLSCEPLLGQIDITPWLRKKGSIHWVIVGGESGPHARPMNPLWIQSLQEQCQTFNILFHFKQWGSWRPPDNGSFHSKNQIFLPDSTGNNSIKLLKVGKKKAGRDFQGRMWNDIPNLN